MMETIRIPTGGGDFAALTLGRPDAPVMLCLHGFPDTPHGFEHVASLFAAGGWRVVAPWLRGYAPSPLDGPYDAEALASDVLTLADAVSPGRPVVLFGHDWGALGCYGAAPRSPKRIAAMITLAVPHPLAFLHNIRRNPRQLARSWYMLFFQIPMADFALRLGGFALVERLWRDWSPGWAPSPEHMIDVKRCLAASLPAPIERYRAMARDLLAKKSFPSARIEVPALYLGGARDGCIGPALATGQARFFEADFEAETVQAAGHFLHMERPGFVAGKTLEWLQKRKLPLGLLRA
jgi:pimeloyl-ACP methyl ester carboxylesterase